MIVFGIYAEELTGEIYTLQSGKSVLDDFGSFTGKISGDKSFNGKAASVYQLHKDGTVTKTDVVVANGAITIALTDMGSVVVALQ